jgi:hypothetical protein
MTKTDTIGTCTCAKCGTAFTPGSGTMHFEFGDDEWVDFCTSACFDSARAAGEFRDPMTGALTRFIATRVPQATKPERGNYLQCRVCAQWTRPSRHVRLESSAGDPLEVCRRCFKRMAPELAHELREHGGRIVLRHRADGTLEYEIAYSRADPRRCAIDSQKLLRALRDYVARVEALDDDGDQNGGGE